MNANEQNLIQYVVDGDIRKAQEQVKIILDNTNTAKDSAFKETMLRKNVCEANRTNRAPVQHERKSQSQKMCGISLKNRFVLRESEKTSN